MAKSEAAPVFALGIRLDWRQAGILVVVFTCNHCPTAQYYEERLKQVVNDYKKKGVALLAINPSPAANSVSITSAGRSVISSARQISGFGAGRSASEEKRSRCTSAVSNMSAA